MEKRTHMEVEIKIPINNADEIREKILSKGGKIKREKHFESNYLFDYLDRSLSAQGFLLRVRDLPEGALLTFKGKVVTHEKYKTRPEAETICLDKEALKTREEYILNDALVCIDQLPFGYYLEIEGEEENIEKVTEILELDKNLFSKKSYAAIFAEICREAGKAFTDILFSPQDEK